MELCCHHCIGCGYSKHQHEQEEIIIKGNDLDADDGPIVGKGMQTNPEIGDGNTETCKIPRFAMKSQTVHGQGAKQDHSCDTKFVVQGSSGASKCEQDQRRLCSNGVIIVTLSDEDVETNQDEQEDA